MQPDRLVPDFDTAVAKFAAGMAPTFTPFASYSALADTLYVYVADAPTFAHRVDRHFTVLVDARDKTSMAGLVVHGLRALVDGQIRSGKVSVGAVVDRTIESKTARWMLDMPRLAPLREQEVCLR